MPCDSGVFFSSTFDPDVTQRTFRVGVTALESTIDAGFSLNLSVMHTDGVMC